ncbi:MAG: chaperone modulator CbpM [Pseudomonadota bacterium]
MIKVYEMNQLDTWVSCSLNELCLRSNLDTDFVVQCVEVGIAEAEGRSPVEWVFTSTAAVRIQKAYRLQRDLEINLNGLAMVLDLLDEVETLHDEVAYLRKKLSHWEHG